MSEPIAGSAEQKSRINQRTGRLFWPLLLLISLIGLAIRIFVGQKTFISFDEWQHVFMAGSARWTDLSFELSTNAHPPLFFILLGGIVRLGHAGLYRVISIAAGAGSIVVTGLIARRVLESVPMQLACAAAFAFSTDAISISAEIRSYQLAVFPTLLAFLAWLSLFSEENTKTRTGSCFTFAICASLAVSSHYSAVFFLGAAVAIALLFAALPPRKIPAWQAISALAVPCAVFGVEYFVHASAQPLQGYLFDFYWGTTPNETLTFFLVKNSHNFFNLFSPVELKSAMASLAIIGIFAAAAAYVLIRDLRARAVSAILFALVMTAELLAAGIAGKYPFGGLLRHEYIAGPFLLIAAFAMADVLISRAGRVWRWTVPLLLAAASITHLIAEGPKLIVYPGLVLLQDEFNAWRAAFPEARAVYVDHWGVIGYFIHTSDRPRSFVRRVPDDAWIDEYHIPAGIHDTNPAGTEIFYDKTRNTLDLSDPSVYRSFAACLRSSGVAELTLFLFSPGDQPFAQPPDEMKRSISQLAAQQGMTATKVVAGRTSVFAGFRLNR